MLVRLVFFEHEADSILAIPFSLSLPPDSRVWAFTAFRRFSLLVRNEVALQAKTEAQKNRGSGENSNP